MLRTLVISPDSILAGFLVQALEQVAGIAVMRIVDHYPELDRLARMLRSQSPDVIFLSARDADRAAELVRSIETGAEVIATHTSCRSDVLLPLMQAGVREFVSPPFERQSLEDAIGRVKTLLDRRPPAAGEGSVFSFLPAKPGVGATTLAINVSVAAAHLPGASTMLADFDLGSGMIRFLLKLRKSYSVVNAVENAVRMDEDIWPGLIDKVDGLDVIHAGHGNPSARLDSAKIRLLIDFLRRRYRVMNFDLSGNLEQYAISILHESKHIFLVTTPELPALHLARQKLDFLASYDLAGRVSLLLNREHKRAAVPRTEVEDIMGLGVHVAFPNDYAGVHRSAALGRPVDPSSALGRQATALAAWMTGAELQTSPTQPPRRRFIEFFFLPRATDSPAARRERVAG